LSPDHNILPNDVTAYASPEMILLI